MGQRKKLQSSWIMVGCAWLLVFGVFTLMFCVPPMEHIIRQELSLSHSQTGLLFSLPTLMVAVIAIPGGLLADRIGIRKAAGIGAVILVLGGIMRGTATSFGALLGFTVLFGVGFGLIFPNLPKLVAGWITAGKTGLATGIYSTGVAIGEALALAITLPVIFPVTNSFQGTFYIWSIPAIVATILWWIVVKEPQHSLEGQQLNRGSKSSYIIWKSRDLWLVAFMLFALNLYFFTWAGWTPELMRQKGASPDLAAFITSVITWASIPAMFLLPWISDKIGLRKPVIWVPAIILALGALGANYISVTLGWFLMTVVGFMCGSFSILLALPVELAPREYVGTASGMMLTIGYLGGLIGPWLAGYIIEATGTLDLVFFILFGVALAMAVMAFLVTETGARARQPASIVA